MARLLVVVTSACAISAAAAFAPPLVGAAERASAHPCSCRSMSGPVEIGGRICVSSAQGWRVAECVMEINVLSWRRTDEPCAPVSRRRASGAAG